MGTKGITGYIHQILEFSILTNDSLQNSTLPKLFSNVEEERKFINFLFFVEFVVVSFMCQFDWVRYPSKHHPIRLCVL